MSREYRQAKELLAAYDAIRARLSGDELMEAIRTGAIERMIEEAQAEAREESERLAEAEATRAKFMQDYKRAGAPFGEAWTDLVKFITTAPRAEYEAAFAPYGGAL